MKKFPLQFVSLIFIICLYSCINTPQSAVEIKSKPILFKIIFTKNDSIKSDAVNFLIDNIKFHKFQFGKINEAYISAINENYNDINLLQKKLERLKTLKYPPSKEVYDASILNKTFLINDINLSYETLNKVHWKNTLSDSIFFNYILPYRFDNEPINNWNWRKHFLSIYIKANGTSIFSKDLASAATDVHKWLIENRKKNFAVKFGSKDLKIPPLPLNIVDKLKVGSCKELALISGSFLRALSIPATFDFVPNYANVNSGHEWSTIIIDSTHIIPFDIENDKLGNYKKETFKLSKVYRKSFVINKISHVYNNGEFNYLPSFFNDPFIRDVTSEYIATINLKLSLKDHSAAQKTCYLSVFSCPAWTPIDFGYIKDGCANFKNIAKSGGIYLPVEISKNKTNALTYPFLLNEDGSIHYYNPDTTNRESITITRKFPTSLLSSDKYVRKMLGGVFQGSNTMDFRNPKDLYKIKDIPKDNFNIIILPKEVKYRYVRYVAPNGSNGNIAELHLFNNSSTKLLKGEVLGTNGSWANTPTKTKYAAFDNNPLTFFYAMEPDNNWVGLDLGKVTSITSLQILPRTDMNGIYENNSYELFYWDYGWKSLGKVVSRTQYLEYNNVPKNALLWIRNLTAGKEERIFTYQNDKQIWW